MTELLPGPIVSPQWLTEHLDDVRIVDVRWYLDGTSGRAAYDYGHLPRAVFVDLDTELSAPAAEAGASTGGRHPLPSPESFAATMARLGIGDDTPVVAYDDRGGVAARLWWMLDSIGHPAAVLDGGINAWTGALDQEPPVVEEAEFTPRPWPTTSFSSAADVALRTADSVLIDARSNDRYSGIPNPIDPRYGHIPGAINAPWEDNLSDRTMRAAGELSAHYADMGIGPHTQVIAYCGSGVSACTDLLALRIAGATDLSLYVGSWSEWGADLDRPVVVDPRVTEESAPTPVLEPDAAGS